MRVDESSKFYTVTQGYRNSLQIHFLHPVLVEETNSGLRWPTS